MKVKTRQEALEKLSKLPEKALIRMAELSENKNALKYFTCPIKHGVVKGFLNK
ncbi:hypothetical protein [uncultured Tenacibaculum sp.]|uniref:hypothetical protein n=1 Tax=uncultured Tenacibaculum sp. TaxID=174713 RepID=UPI00261281AC|nr:hypothetical protein [uncultured Tenacibaculum sp.]